MAIPRAFASLSLGLTLVLVVAPLCSMACNNILYQGERLREGQSLTSGSYSLIMDHCELALSDNGNTVWTSNTKYKDVNCYASVTKNGDFVIYRPSGAALWQTGKNGEEGDYILVLQKDGKVAVYGPQLWISTTTFAALPANKAEKEAKAGRISMVVNE